MTVAGDKLIVAGFTHVRNDPREGRSLTVTRLNARQDGAGPRLAVKGLPHHRCVNGTADLVVLTRDESRVTTHARIDRRRLATNTRHRFHIELDTSDLKPGHHRLRVRSTDAAGTW